MPTISPQHAVALTLTPRSYVLETLIGLGIISVVNLLWFSNQPAFNGVHPHPYWIVILPIAARYGMRAALFVAGMASLFYLGQLLPTRPDITLVDMRAWEYWGPIVLFVAVSVVLGEIREGADRECERITGERDTLRKDFDRLHKQYAALDQAKEAMDRTVITQEQTLSLLYESSQGLRTLTEDAVYPAVLDLLARHTGAESAAVYLLDGGILRRRATFGPPPALPHGVPVRPDTLDPEKGLAKLALAQGQTVSLPESGLAVATDGFLAVAPLVSGGQPVLGIIGIEAIPFHLLVPQTGRVLGLLADWCASSVHNARTYVDTRSHVIADDTTGAYTFGYFQERIEEEFARSRRFGLPLSLLCIRVTGIGTLPEETRSEVLALVCQIIHGVIRKVDMLFRHEAPDTLLVVLPGTALEGADIVANKCTKELHAFQYPGSAAEATVGFAHTMVSRSTAHASGLDMLRQAQEAFHA